MPTIISQIDMNVKGIYAFLMEIAHIFFMYCFYCIDSMAYEICFYVTNYLDKEDKGVI